MEGIVVSRSHGYIHFEVNHRQNKCDLKCGPMPSGISYWDTGTFAIRHLTLGHGKWERSQFIRRYGISITQVHVEEENEIYTYRPQYLTDVDSSNLFLIDYFIKECNLAFYGVIHFTLASC